MESRSEGRHPVEIQGRYRTGSGTPRDVIVKDLSARGCRIFDRFCNLTIGKYISIRIGSIGPLEARVMWRENNLAGLRFGESIHAHVLEHMVTTLDGWSRPSE
jgi:hypothetical protein